MYWPHPDVNSVAIVVRPHDGDLTEMLRESDREALQAARCRTSRSEQ